MAVRLTPTSLDDGLPMDEWLRLRSHSYWGGHITDRFHLPGWSDVAAPAPRGSRWQNIHFVTDLDGRPINDD